MAEYDGPRTFGELGQKASEKGKRCARCGEPAVCRVAIYIRELNPAGQGGTPHSIVHHSNTLCEGCAVPIFVQTRKAIR